jgi:hypothetical protein
VEIVVDEEEKRGEEGFDKFHTSRGLDIPEI